MGSLFEAAQLIFFDLVSIMLRERTGQHLRRCAPGTRTSE